MGMPVRSLAADEFLDPLEFLRSEHERQFEFINQFLLLSGELQVEQISDSIEELISYLTVEIALHHKDEEADLFPLLREYCTSYESVDQILAELDRDHATENFLALHIVLDLESIVDGKTIENPIRLLMNIRAFAEGQVRHLNWENNVVLPLARTQLGPEQLQQMGRNMAARHELA